MNFRKITPFLLILLLLTGCGAGQNTGSNTPKETYVTDTDPSVSTTSGFDTTDSGAAGSDTTGSNTAGIEIPEGGMPYVEFYARKMHKDPSEIDLSQAVCVTCMITECEYANPLQYIRTPESVAKAVEVMQNITITGGADGIVSTGHTEGFSLLDADGRTVISISIQDGGVVASEGRYGASGLGAIDSIPGFMTSEDWDAYYNSKLDEEEEYQKNHKLDYPVSLFEAEGKYAFDFYNNCTSADIVKIYLYGDRKTICVRDRAEIERIYGALCSVSVTGEGQFNRWKDSQWDVSIAYVMGENTFEDEISFVFKGRALWGGDQVYAIDDVMPILDSYSWEGFEAMKEELAQ